MKFKNAEENQTLERVPPAKIAGGGGGCLSWPNETNAEAIFAENRRCIVRSNREALFWALHKHHPDQSTRHDTQTAYQQKSVNEKTVKGTTWAKP